MSIKQSVCVPMVQPPEISQEEFFPALAEIGFAAVEFWGLDDSIAQTARLAQANGLEIASAVGHQGIDSGLNDPRQHERIWAELRASIALAEKFHIHGLICFSGARNPAQTPADAIQQTIIGLQGIAPIAERAGVTLNMEFLNTKVDHVGYDFDHMSWGLEVVRRVNSPNVKILYDIYHAQIMEGNLIQTIQESAPWIGHFHTAGVPGRNELDGSQEINYRAVCKVITATGYAKFIGHEFKPTRAPLDSLRQAYEICAV